MQIHHLFHQRQRVVARHSLHPLSGCPFQRVQSIDI